MGKRRVQHMGQIDEAAARAMAAAEYDCFNALLGVYEQSGLQCGDCALTRLLALVSKFALANARGSVAEVEEDMAGRAPYVLAAVIEASRRGMLGEEMEAALARLDAVGQARH